jgi:hypothetical protein
VRLDGAALSILSWNRTHIRIQPPAGRSLGHTFNITVGGQSTTTIDSVFYYAPPSLLSVAGCQAGPSGSTVNCPVNGTSVKLTIDGLNFGASLSLPVTVDRRIFQIFLLRCFAVFPIYYLRGESMFRA